jgi:hypothetical protein
VAGLLLLKRRIRNILVKNSKNVKNGLDKNCFIFASNLYYNQKSNENLKNQKGT